MYNRAPWSSHRAGSIVTQHLLNDQWKKINIYWLTWAGQRKIITLDYRHLANDDVNKVHTHNQGQVTWKTRDGRTVSQIFATNQWSLEKDLDWILWLKCTFYFELIVYLYFMLYTLCIYIAFTKCSYPFTFSTFCYSLILKCFFFSHQSIHNTP